MSHTVVVPRLVLDTNILVAAAYAPSSASRKIVQRIADCELSMVVGDAVLAEYRFVLMRAVRRVDFVPVIERVLHDAEICQDPVDGRWVTDDPTDDKFIAIALAARVDALLSNDHHVLKIGQLDGVRILRPTQFLRAEETDS